MMQVPWRRNIQNYAVTAAHISTRKKRVRALSHDEETDRSWLTLRFFAPDHSQNFLRAGSTPDAEEVAAEASAVETFSKA